MKNQMDKNKNSAQDNYDSPWKIILTEYFEQFMLFFFPKIYEQINWSLGYESLDKELHQVMRGSLPKTLFLLEDQPGTFDIIV